MKKIDFPVAYFKIYPLLFLLLILFIGSAETWAITTPPNAGQKGTALEINKDSLQAKIEAIKTRQGLDEAQKSKVLSIYQSAQDNLGNI
jgi:potassium efflux system protein